VLALAAAAGALLTPVDASQAQLLITGNDEKISFDETGKTINRPPGKDTVSIIDVHDPIAAARRICFGSAAAVVVGAMTHKSNQESRFEKSKLSTERNAKDL
jgi:hypothetical protein